MAPYVDDRKGLTESQIVESVVQLLSKDSYWKKTLGERRSEIERQLGESFTNLRVARLSSKFSSLYNEGASIPLVKHEGYRELLRSDVEYLSERISALLDLVEAAVAVRDNNRLATESLKSEGPLSTFASFSSDLIGDLRNLKNLVQESAGQIGSVSLLAKVYDAVVDRLFDFEVAGRFVDRMSFRLCNPDKR